MPKIKYPKNCFVCPKIAKADATHLCCTESNQNGKPRNWIFSPELAKQQALCDEKVNAELPTCNV